MEVDDCDADMIEWEADPESVLPPSTSTPEP